MAETLVVAIEALGLPEPPSAQRTPASADATSWVGYYVTRTKFSVVSIHSSRAWRFGAGMSLARSKASPIESSGMLAVVTLLLPLTMVSGLVLSVRRQPWSATSLVDVVAMAAVLQWTVVLAWWGLMPMRLWS